MAGTIHNYASATLDPDIELVVFGWSNKHGHCYECGCPAAFYVGERANGTFEQCERLMREQTNGERGCETPDAHDTKPEGLRCAVCAANAAADGEHITRIEEVE